MLEPIQLVTLKHWFDNFVGSSSITQTWHHKTTTCSQHMKHKLGGKRFETDYEVTIARNLLRRGDVLILPPKVRGGAQAHTNGQGHFRLVLLQLQITLDDLAHRPSVQTSVACTSEEQKEDIPLDSLRLQRLSQYNRIKQRRAWLLLRWLTAERSYPCKQPACLAIVGGSEVTFKPLVPRLC
ncbi:hypothetical protein J6590_064707 [Homalodisca vitripennis]|nr:hypothetical protein J6590_064707 [Homalodisca vitripennis]